MRLVRLATCDAAPASSHCGDNRTHEFFRHDYANGDVAFVGLIDSIDESRHTPCSAPIYCTSAEGL